MCQAHSDVLAPLVLDMLQRAASQCPPGACSRVDGPRLAGVPVRVLAKEAVYNAAGATAFHLHDLIDFTQWFTTALLTVCKAVWEHACSRIVAHGQQ